MCQYPYITNLHKIPVTFSPKMLEVVYVYNSRCITCNKLDIKFNMKYKVPAVDKG